MFLPRSRRRNNSHSELNFSLYKITLIFVTEGETLYLNARTILALSPLGTLDHERRAPSGRNQNLGSTDIRTILVAIGYEQSLFSLIGRRQDDAMFTTDLSLISLRLRNRRTQSWNCVLSQFVTPVAICNTCRNL